MDAKLGGDASEATHKSVNALPPLPPPPMSDGMIKLHVLG